MKQIVSRSMITALFVVISTGILYVTSQEAFATLIVTYSETVSGDLVKGDCTTGDCFEGGPTYFSPFLVPGEYLAVTEGTLRLEAHADLDGSYMEAPNRESLLVVIDDILRIDDVFQLGGNPYFVDEVSCVPAEPSVTELIIPMDALNIMIADGSIALEVTAHENVDWPFDTDVEKFPFFLKATLTYDYDPPAESIPEPATIFLFCSGLIGLAVFRKRIKMR